MEDTLSIVYFYADSQDEWNTSNWRVVMPATAIQKQGVHECNLLHLSEFACRTPKANNLCTLADIIILERNLFFEVLDQIKYWKAQGKVIVANFDDAYQYMNKGSISYEFWNEGKIRTKTEDGKEEIQIVDPKPIKQFEEGLKLCDAAIMPSKVLVNDWKHLTKTYYVPNYPDISTYINLTKTPDPFLKVAWGGSISHLKSWTESGILPAIRKVILRYDFVKLLICGDERVAKEVGLPKEKIIFQPFVDFKVWAKVVNTFDIGLAPLAQAYDERRSWIKPLEYMLLKIPWLATKNKAYKDIAPYGTLVENDPKQWELKLDRMIKHPEDFRDKIRAGYEFALQQDINLHVEEMITLFRKIISEHQNPLP